MKIVKEYNLGARTIGGTDFPIVSRVERRQMPGKRAEWVVVDRLCNGVPREATAYRTQKEALAELYEIVARLEISTAIAEELAR